MFVSQTHTLSLCTWNKFYEKVFDPHSAVIYSLWRWFTTIWVIADVFVKLSQEKKKTVEVGK